MKQNNSIPQGYKDSPLGIIPVEWEVKQFIDICKVNQGLQIPISERLKIYEPNSYKYITIQYLNNAKEEEFIKNPNPSVMCTYEDILMTRTGNTGIVISDVEGVFHNNFFKIAYDKKVVNKSFLIEFLNTKKTQHLILVKAGTSTIPDLNHKDFYSIYISLPPLPEQQKIAEILSTWDEAIEKQTQIIAQLETRKRGLMQQLLTGKKRLKGFEGTWREMKLGEICIFNKGQGLSKSQLNINGKNKCILYGELFTKYREVIINVASNTNIEAGYFSQKEDILFPSSTTTKGIDLAKSSTLLKNDVLLGGDIIVLRKKGDNYNSIFLTYYLNTIKKFEIAQCAKGVTVYHLYSDDLIDIEVMLPPIEEQTAIAAILSTADKEIDLAKKKLTGLKEQKKGLMQVLLTGKKRVKH
jgi:type I restriction enzyme S subunit